MGSQLDCGIFSQQKQWDLYCLGCVKQALRGEGGRENKLAVSK